MCTSYEHSASWGNPLLAGTCSQFCPPEESERYLVPTRWHTVMDASLHNYTLTFLSDLGSVYVYMNDLLINWCMFCTDVKLWGGYMCWRCLHHTQRGLVAVTLSLWRSLSDQVQVMWLQYPVTFALWVSWLMPSLILLQGMHYYKVCKSKNNVITNVLLTQCQVIPFINNTIKGNIYPNHQLWYWN